MPAPSTVTRQDQTFLTTRQVAKATGLNIQTVRRYCREHIFQAVQAAPKRGYRIPLQEVISYNAAHREKRGI